ncbi:hypothetical protein AS159_09905 [Thermotoga sp. Ku-13t]|uniref:TMEM198/TM7SF3 family protein n=1 Tax=Thermotoga sp. Ku-13t TaxID=1755813 RepID=UPI0013EB7C50|nr:TMEM198/TM7SF3 family protein [Thermotoga sp. Ku-13t]KAF2957324.1 hypothetical protein AS159_09905 [Thermotoga sp. Ku-13t]
MNLEFLKPHVVLELWYLVVPISVFVVLAAKYLENILMPMLGFMLGGFFVSPMLIEWMGKVEFLKGIQQKLLENYTLNLIFVVVLGLLCGAVLYGLYKIFVFLAGFLAGGALGYFVTQLVIRERHLGTLGQLDLNILIPIGVGIALGVICGLIAVKKSAQVLAVISLLVASYLLAFSAVGWLYVWIAKSPKQEVSKLFESQPIVFALFFVWLILFVFGLSLNFRKRARQAPKGKETDKINQ